MSYIYKKYVLGGVFMSNSDIHKKILKMKNQTLKKTKDMSETLQISTVLRTEEERQKELLQNMGQICYEKEIFGEAEELKALHESVTECRERIKEYKDRLRILKGSTVCPVCGNTVKSDEKFCSRCGKDMTKETVPELQHTGQEPTSLDVHNITNLENVPVPLFAAAMILQFSLIILWFMKSISINVFGVAASSLSPHTTFVQSNASVVSLISIILCIAALGKTIYTLLYKNPMQKYKMKFQIAVTVWYFLVQLLIFVSVISQVYSKANGLADFSITIGGWLYLIVCVSLFVVLIKISKGTKAKKYEESES